MPAPSSPARKWQPAALSALGAVVTGCALGAWGRATSLADSWMAMFTCFGALGLWALGLECLQRYRGEQPRAHSWPERLAFAAVTVGCLSGWVALLVFARGPEPGNYQAHPGFYVAEAFVLAAAAVAVFDWADRTGRLRDETDDPSR